MDHGSSKDGAASALTLSVVVSTHNRAEKLRATLASLAACEIPPHVDWEVLVADNSSVDDTERVVRGLIARFPARLMYVYQSTLSKSTGANLALRHLRGNLIAFLDDDVRVARRWAAEIVATYARDPQLGGLGGRVENLDAAASTIGTRRSAATAVISPESVDLSCMPITGANLCFRRELLERIGAYDESLGPGTAVGGAEDLDLVYRAMRTGCRLIYLPQALVYHDPGRRTDAELARCRRGYLRGRGAFYAKHFADARVLKSIYYESRADAISVFRELAHGHIDRDTFGSVSAMMGGAIAYLRGRGGARPGARAPTRLRQASEPGARRPQ